MAYDAGWELERLGANLSQGCSEEQDDNGENIHLGLVEQDNVEMREEERDAVFQDVGTVRLMKWPQEPLKRLNEDG